MYVPVTTIKTNAMFNKFFLFLSSIRKRYLMESVAKMF